MRILHFLRSFPTWIFILSLTLLVTLAALFRLIILRQSPERVLGMIVFWGKTICRASGVVVRVEGTEKLLPGQPYIFTANHQSQFDIMVLQGYLGRNLRWLAKKELFKVPLWGTAMRRAGYIPIDRSHGRRALQSLEEAAAQIAEGISVVIFPEGTRSPDGRLRQFKPGALVLALKSGVPLVPVAVSGTHRVLPKGSLLITPGPVTIKIGDPIPAGEYSNIRKQELAQQLEKRVAGLMGRQNS